MFVISTKYCEKSKERKDYGDIYKLIEREANFEFIE